MNHYQDDKGEFKRSNEYYENSENSNNLGLATPSNSTSSEGDEEVGHDEKCAFVALCLNLIDQIQQETRSIFGGENYEYEKFSNTLDHSLAHWSINLTVRMVTTFELDHTTMECIDTDRKNASNYKYSQFLVDRLSRSQRSKALLCRLLAASLAQTGFDARTAALLEILAFRLRIPADLYATQAEKHVLQPIKGRKMHDDQDLTGQNQPQRHRKRLILSGIGAAVGGTLVAATAGLAAPFVAPALASVFGLSSLAAFVASTSGIVTVSLLFGAAGAGLTGYKVSQRFGTVSDFSFVPVNTDDRLTVSVAISGWLKNPDDVWRPWLKRSIAHDTNVLSQGNDLYALQFEKERLLDLGSALERFVLSSSASIATTQLLMTQAALAGAVSAIMFPVAVLQLGDLIDNPWSVGMDRAKLAGRILADVIRNRVHGHRPISLYGYSLGAAVIVTCLEELVRMAAEEGDEGVFGVIQNVAIFGTPALVDPPERWSRMRAMVAGRFVHGYCRNDWVLRFLYRSASLSFQDEIVGVGPLSCAPTIESVDLGGVEEEDGIVEGHLSYGSKMPEIISLLGLY